MGAGVLVLLLVVVRPAPGAGAAAPTFDEYQVKAAFLLNLARFVEWPAEAFASASTPVGFCIVGTDPFGRALDDAVYGHQVSGRSAVVLRLKQIPDEPGCHVVFVAGADVAAQAAAIERLGRSSVLTVSEARSFAAAGGAIALFVEDQRVRFEVNAVAAERAGLRISSRVLALASAVHRKGTAP